MPKTRRQTLSMAIEVSGPLGFPFPSNISPEGAPAGPPGLLAPLYPHLSLTSFIVGGISVLGQKHSDLPAKCPVQWDDWYGGEVISCCSPFMARMGGSIARLPRLPPQS